MGIRPGINSLCEANVFSTLPQTGPGISVRLVSALLATALLASPLCAQSPCSECFTAADEELRRCLDNAFSVDDKAACADRRDERMKACSNNVCKIERDEAAATKQQMRSQPDFTPYPGLTPYTPTKIEWLALVVNSQLRQAPTHEGLYSLDVVQWDHETLLISVRYRPTVGRAVLDRSVETAREAILSTARRYGWDNWVKIRERIEVSPLPR